MGTCALTRLSLALSSRGLVRDVNVGTEDRNLGVLSLEDKVNLHGNGGAIVQVLAGSVEVELGKVEGLVAAGEFQGARLAHHLDGGAQVLKDGALGEVGQVNGQARPGDLGEGAAGDIDGRLVGAFGAGGVGGGVEAEPISRALGNFVRKNSILALQPKQGMELILESRN